MISTSLTSEHVRLKDGTTAFPYEWDDEIVLIRDDAKTVLEVIQLFSDKKTKPENKQERFLESFFVSWSDAFSSCKYDKDEFELLIKKATWDICGLDIEGNRYHEPPLWDIEQDAAIIRTSFRQAYGIEWDELRGKIAFSEFIALIGGIPHETPLGQALYYRNKKTRPKTTKHNKEQLAQWDRLHKAFSLSKKPISRNSMEVQNEAMSDLALAFKTAAR